MRELGILSLYKIAELKPGDKIRVWGDIDCTVILVLQAEPNVIRVHTDRGVFEYWARSTYGSVGQRVLLLEKNKGEKHVQA